MKYFDILKEKFQNKILSYSISNEEEYIYIESKSLSEICVFIKKDLYFDMLIDLTCVDYLNYPGRKMGRFEMAYQFYSLKNNHRLCLKSVLDDAKPVIDSLSNIWLAANWYEREVYDMFGVYFKGHPDLRRILMYDEFIGHPLRKDYPLKKRQPRIAHPD
jgi:NADH-quinone oxidoreductase subunit C